MGPLLRPLIYLMFLSAFRQWHCRCSSSIRRPTTDKGLKFSLINLLTPTTTRRAGPECIHPRRTHAHTRPEREFCVLVREFRELYLPTSTMKYARVVYFRVYCTVWATTATARGALAYLAGYEKCSVGGKVRPHN